MKNIQHILLPIDQIELQESNPRSITDADMEALVRDIKADPSFLFQRPPLVNLVNGRYICYAGTQRVKACRLSGGSEIYCFVEDNVSQDVQDKRMLQDNLHRGEWDIELLNAYFKPELLADVGFTDEVLSTLEGSGSIDSFADEGIGYKSQFGVIVLCDSEDQQQALYEELTAKGHNCKIVVT